MHRRGLRLGLVIAFVIALAGAGTLLYTGHQRELRASASALDLEVTRDRAQAAIDDARVGIIAALAPGQDEAYWLPRVTAALESAKNEINAMKSLASPSAASDLDAAAASLDKVSAQRVEVARLLAGDMRSQASRLALGDGLQSLAGAGERIDSVRWNERTRRDAEVGDLRALEWLALGSLVAFALVVVGLLLPVTESPATPEATVATLATAAVETPASPDQPRTVGETTPAAAEGTLHPAALAAAQALQASLTSPDHIPENGATLPQVDRRKAPELRAAADLCFDFARLVDAQELPALLERSARLLDATGFIVWLADPDGQYLRPSLAHGFAPQTLSRLPAIPRHADNATAAAFRHAEMQVVRTNGMSPGAIVVPILGSSGCVGVMAAEVRHGREASESARALARIVAAQLGNVIGNPAAKTLGQPTVDAAQQAV